MKVDCGRTVCPFVVGSGREPPQLIWTDAAGGGQQVHGVTRSSRNKTDAARYVNKHCCHGNCSWNHSPVHTLGHRALNTAKVEYISVPLTLSRKRIVLGMVSFFFSGMHHWERMWCG